MTNIKLTVKQQRFIEEYLIDLNATRAAKEAGYSIKTARSQGQRLLTNVDIQNAIHEAIETRSERTEITQDKVLNDIETTRLLAINARQYNVAAKCSELQGRYLKLFTDKHEYSRLGPNKPPENVWILQGVKPDPMRNPKYAENKSNDDKILTHCGDT